jgi:hypothetical protein
MFHENSFYNMQLLVLILLQSVSVYVCVVGWGGVGLVTP